jgi:hypothetical protein
MIGIDLILYIIVSVVAEMKNVGDDSIRRCKE